MDHNLDDSLNLEGDMGSMDFDHSGVVVNQEDITLEATSHEGDMPMEFEHIENIEEQPMLMDTGNEEIIVSDFMGDQFTLQEYSTQDEVIPETSELVEINQMNILESQSESMIDLNFESKIMSQNAAQEVPVQSKYIHVKAASIPPPRVKKEPVMELPRHVAIAPKPPKLSKAFSLSSPPFAIAPKPAPTFIIGNKNASLVKKVSLTGVVQGASSTGNAVLTQIGKQLVMVPAGGGQKIKLVTSGSGVQYVRASAAEQSQLISAKQITGTNLQKPVLKKFIVQNIQSQSSMAEGSNPPTLKLAAGTTKARYVMQPKTVPINIGGTKVLLASPTKQGIKLKKQIISIQQPQKLLTATSQGATTTKKVVITANPSQNVILKTTAPPKTAQITKEGQVVVQGQRSQLHQINVPGKGIQYIRLITNPTPAPQKPVVKPTTSVTLPGYVLSDAKGNIIQMSEGMSSEDPPPLIPTGSTSTPKMTTKPQKKLVRIAPRPIKSTTMPMLQQSRSSQSLLAPLSPVEVIDHEQSDSLVEQTEIEESALSRDSMVSEGEDYATLRALPSEEERGMVDHDGHNMHEVEVEFERQETSVEEEEEEESNSMEALGSSNRTEEHPLIVIPSNYDKNVRVSSDSSRHSMMTDCKEYPNMQINVEGEAIPVPYLSPKQSHSLSDTDLVSADLGLRPRKACNCTKSQCLKLYCDCFANGEFCNSCNCTNCHNNLDNEELRQKAIRACLDRNPNAFRPKIGKAKNVGPDVVRRHNKGCNCKRSGCLKNYCECYEAKIACTAMCKCVGCRNIEETLDRRRDVMRLRDKLSDPMFRPKPIGHVKQPCSFMTSEVIEAVCQCLVAAAVEADAAPKPDADPMRDVIEEFARCLQDIISASHQSHSLDEGQS